LHRTHHPRYGTSDYRSNLTSLPPLRGFILEPCCQSDGDAREPTCQDRCCTGPSLPSPDSPSLECNPGMQSVPLLSQCSGTKTESDARPVTAEDDRDCCSDCIPKDLSECGQTCQVGIGAIDDNEDHVVVSTVEPHCYSNSVPEKACPLVTARTANNGNDCASDVGDDCCSDCTPKDLPASGPRCSVGTKGTTDNKDNAAAPTMTASRAYAELSPLCI